MATKIIDSFVSPQYTTPKIHQIPAKYVHVQTSKLKEEFRFRSCNKTDE